MSDFDPRFDPAFQRGYDGPILPTTKATDATATAAPPLVSIDPTVAAPLEQADVDVAPDRRGNPFLVALAAIAVALTAGGLTLVFQLRTIFAENQSSASFDYITLQTLMIGAPILAGLGIATGVGVLFVYAVRWGRGGSGR